MTFKKIWNNRIFRTFIQTSLGAIFSYFAVNNITETNNKALIGIIISAIATGLSAIMPLIDDEEE